MPGRDTGFHVCALVVDPVQLTATRERRPSNARHRGNRADRPHCSRLRFTTGVTVSRRTTDTTAGGFMTRPLYARPLPIECPRLHSVASLPGGVQNETAAAVQQA